MSILEALLASAKGGTLGDAAAELGLDASKASDLVGALGPVLAGGLKRNAGSADGLAGLVGALAGGGHQRYLEEPGALSPKSATQDGNKILGHILGSKDVSRELAGRVAGTSGVDASLIKKFLPVLAAAAMGALSAKTEGGTQLGSESAKGGAGDMLDSLLGQSGGGMVGDVLDLARKFF